jgi:hypothetical protein
MSVPEIAVVDEPQYIHALICFPAPLLWRRFCLLSGRMLVATVTDTMREEQDVTDGGN